MRNSSLLTVAEVARELDISSPRVRDLLRLGKVRFPRLWPLASDPELVTWGALQRYREELAHAARFTTDPAFHPEAEPPYWEDGGCRLLLEDVRHVPGSLHVDVARACPKTELGRGWWPLLDVAFDACDEYKTQVPFEVRQVKQKFGGLRIQLAAPWFVPADLRDLLSAIEERSELTCEACGAPGTCGWGPSVRTLCDSCGPPWQATFSARMDRNMQELFGGAPDEPLA